jgi:hypothetical protein
MPIFSIAENYAAMRLLGDELPVQQARFLLLKFAQQLFSEYALKPHEVLLKSQNGRAIKKLQIMRSVLEDLEFAPPSDFNKRIKEWREAVRFHYLALIREKNARAREAAEALWNRDQFLTILLNGEKPDPQKHAKQELSYIVLTAVKDTLGEQVHYLLAQAWQEEAERSQASWERGRKPPRPKPRFAAWRKRTRPGPTFAAGGKNTRGVIHWRGPASSVASMPSPFTGKEVSKKKP